MRLPRRTGDGGVGTFALVAGLLIGALLTAVALPRRAPETVVTGFAPGQSEQAADGSAAAGEITADGVAVGSSSASGRASSSAGQRSAATGGGSDGAGGSGEVEASSSVRGVTDDTVRIGVAYPNLDALRSLGPAYDNGDVPKQWRAVLDRWKREGVVPIAGRNVELTFRDYQVLEPADQRAACAGFVQDDKVFAVVGVAFFQVGSECVAREFGTPLLTSDGPTETVFSRSKGNLFSLYLSQDSIVRNWAQFAADNGLIAGKVVGIYHHTGGIDPEMAALLEERVTALGAAEVEVASTDQTISGPSDAVAAQRFRAAGVTTAFLLTAKAGFMNQAEAQQYRPTYVESDYLFGTGDSVHSSSPPEQMDQTLGITATFNGWHAAGMPQPKPQAACIDNYRRVTGEEPNEPGSAEFNYIALSCDFSEVIRHALAAAGRNLTPAAFIAAIEGFSSSNTSQVGGLSFAPSRHAGADRLRTVQWHADCRCWRAIGSFYPLLTP